MMKKFLKKLSLYLLIPFAIIGVNYFGDPANLYHEEYELSIANNLVNGFHVTNIYNHNERLLQKKIIQNNPDCPEAIVLGSSRGMLINKSATQYDFFFNNAMSGSVLEDNIAIYELYEQRGCPIRTVIISLDPWILNDNNGEQRWKGLQSEYDSFLAKLYNKPANDALIEWRSYEIYKQLLSFSYFKSSLYYLAKGTRRNDARTTTQAENNGLTRLADGAVSWDASYREAPQSVVDRRANDLIALDPVEFLGDFDHLSVRYKKLFIDFVSYLQRRNVKVEFLLTPFHPVVYNTFKKKDGYRNVAASEEFFKRIAQQKGIETFGSFDPAKFNFKNSDFYDGFHCNGDAIVKILNSRSARVGGARKSML